MANLRVFPLDSGTNNYLNPLRALTMLATDLVTPGVVGAITNTAGIAPCTGAFAVNAQGSPNMSVAVTGGDSWVNATPTNDVAQNFGVNMDVAQNVTINANSSGSTVYDFIYLQIDPTQVVNPAATGVGGASLITSRSTTAYSATGANQGNSNGAVAGILLAVVTVANSAASITNANITDARQLTVPSIPAWQTWVPTYTGFSVTPSAVTARYQQVGKIVTCYLTATAGTSNATTFTFTLPVPAKSSLNNLMGNVTDNGVTAAGPGMIALAAGSTTATVYKDGASTAWTATGSKNFQFGHLIYEAQ